MRVFASAADVKRRPFNRLRESLIGADEDDAIRPQNPNRSDGEPGADPQQYVIVDSPHVIEPLRPRSLAGQLADSILHLGSGDEAVEMAEPLNLTTDSRQRVIVTDPAAHAIHVFDFQAKKYFCIQGGRGRRLQSPTGVAVDVQDNIYVTDSKLGMILVYGPDGSFLRFIGGRHEEGGDYDTPNGIAIDRKAGRIYLSDTSQHYIFVLDLQGKVLERWGKRGGDAVAPGLFKNPTAILISGDQILVRDSNGCRVQTLDSRGNVRRQLRVSFKDCNRQRGPGGMATDSDGNIYVNRDDGSISAFDSNRTLLHTFGPTGSRRGEFRQPQGLWIAQDYLYVADSQNHRVQMFQIHKTPNNSHKIK